ncbi:MAG: hypothetical protein ACFNVN_09690, partial [Capnocytophaga ochracea]
TLFSSKTLPSPFRTSPFPFDSSDVSLLEVYTLPKFLPVRLAPLAKLISDIIGIIRISGTIGIIGIYLIF